MPFGEGRRESAHALLTAQASLFWWCSGRGSGCGCNTGEDDERVGTQSRLLGDPDTGVELTVSSVVFPASANGRSFLCGEYRDCTYCGDSPLWLHRKADSLRLRLEGEAPVEVVGDCFAGGENADDEEWEDFHQGISKGQAGEEQHVRERKTVDRREREGYSIRVWGPRRGRGSANPCTPPPI